MGGFIVLEDGRACAPSNRGTDLMLEEIAAYVREREFREWILDQRSTIVGLGLTKVDVRELTPEDREELRRATRSAYAALSADDNRPDDEWHQSYLEYFAALVYPRPRCCRTSAGTDAISAAGPTRALGDTGAAGDAGSPAASVRSTFV